MRCRLRNERLGHLEAQIANVRSSSSFRSRRLYKESVAGPRPVGPGRNRTGAADCCPATAAGRQRQGSDHRAGRRRYPAAAPGQAAVHQHCAARSQPIWRKLRAVPSLDEVGVSAALEALAQHARAGRWRARSPPKPPSAAHRQPRQRHWRRNCSTSSSGWCRSAASDRTKRCCCRPTRPISCARTCACACSRRGWRCCRRIRRHSGPICEAVSEQLLNQYFNTRGCRVAAALKEIETAAACRSRVDAARDQGQPGGAGIVQGGQLMRWLISILMLPSSPWRWPWPDATTPATWCWSIRRGGWKSPSSASCCCWSAWWWAASCCCGWRT
jgi:hypothetical protein